eukprot:gene15000-biopygen6635
MAVLDVAVLNVAVEFQYTYWESWATLSDSRARVARAKGNGTATRGPRICPKQLQPHCGNLEKRQRSHAGRGSQR